MARDTKINITLNKRLSWGLKIIFIIIGFLCVIYSVPADATYVPFNTNVNQNVGIGTSTPQSAFDVANGNVGIGTWSPSQALQVVGTIQATAFSGDGSGLTGVLGGGWTLGASNVGISTTNNVGIGTNLTATAGLTVMNGNVGIGTWVPSGMLDIHASFATTGFPLTVENSGYYNAYFQGTNPNNQTSFYLDNDRGSFASYGGFLYGGSTSNLADLFGQTRADKLFMFADGTDNLGMYIGTLGAEPFVIGTNNAERIRVDSTGNVGIGGSPLALLHIKSAGGVNSGIRLEDTNASSYGTIDFYTPSGLAGQFVSSGASFSNGLIGGDQTVLANELTNGALQLGSLGTNGYVTLFSGGLTASNERMRITPNGNIGIGTSTPQGSFVVTNGNVGIGTWAPAGALSVMNGNVGIGVNNPQSNLDVESSNSVSISAVSSLTTGDAQLVAGANNGTASTIHYLVFGPSATGTSFGLSRASLALLYADGTSLAAMGVGSVANVPVIWGTNNAERLRIDTAGNVGIGTTTPQAGLVVMNGNVGIGTWTAAGGDLIVNGGGNVGIGSAWPGQVLDVNGSVRATAFIGNGSGLTGVTGGEWVLGAGNVGISTTNNVGIGTSFTTTAALSVMSGNVGIGTWLPGGALIVQSGNVGIGSLVPGQILDVTGTVRMTGLILTGNNAGNGYVMVGNSIGIGTWMPASTLASGAVNSGTANQVAYYSSTGTAVSGSGGMVINGSNVGIGTASPGQALEVNGGLLIDGSGDSYLKTGNYGIDTTTPQTTLAVLGNVGIGTWTAAGGNLIVNGGSNVGIGSVWPGQALDVQGTVRDIGEIINGNVGIGTSLTTTAAVSVMNGNVGIGTWIPSQALAVKGNISYTGRIVKRTTSYANATSITPNSDTDDISYMANTQSAGTFTVNADAGSNQVNGQSWVLKISSTSTQTFSWNAQYDGGSIGLPTSTLGNGTIQYFSFIWDSINSKWDYTGNVGGF